MQNREFEIVPNVNLLCQRKVSTKQNTTIIMTTPISLIFKLFFILIF